MFLHLPAEPPSLTTDCARYRPGQVVHFKLSKSTASRVRFFHLGNEIGSVRPTGTTFDWKPPVADGHGYLAVADGASCGVDVSSVWTLYPRYGYLAHFGPEIASQAPAWIAKLNKLHLNGLQFYDWQWRHHRPLSPKDEWVDIANRPTSAATIRALIAEAHKRNMACMAYNLGYGGVDGSDEDDVSRSWGMFDDAMATKQYSFEMPDGWATKHLDFYDPGNPGWQNMLFPREKAAIEAFGFDGWHMDQVGNPGPKFTSTGQPMLLKDRLTSFLNATKKNVPGTLIFNNVGGYGLDESLKSKTDAMYAEMWEWEGQKTYSDLQAIIDRSRATGKPSLITAYMDYDKAKKYDGRPSVDFNPSGVLLTDATILASGGSHLELGDGDSMLDHEYFPNHNLKPGADLLSRLKSYYDFQVAYEELLASHSMHPSSLALQGDGLSSKSEPGKIWSFARSDGSRTVFHLINLSSAQDVEWRDRDGLRNPPKRLSHVRVKLPDGAKGRVWMATSDDGVGGPHPLTVKDGWVVVPNLEYWSMLVVEG